MKVIGIFLVMLTSIIFVSCSESPKTDNVTHHDDTMVIKQDRTDSATNSVTTDTTKR